MKREIQTAVETLSSTDDSSWLTAPVSVSDPISADAHYIARCAREAASEGSGRIVKHLWIIFVCLPVVLGILFAILTAK
jgi:hypothetical protein